MWAVNAYLVVRLIGSIVAGIGQAFLPEIAARSSSWGSSPGWQREVGLWNLGVAFVIVLALARWNAPSRVDLTWGLVALAVLLGVNHGLEVLRGHADTLHVSALAVNALVAII